MFRYTSGESLKVFSGTKEPLKNIFSYPHIATNLLQIIHDSLWAMPVLSCLPLTPIPTVSFLLSFHCAFVYFGVFLAIFYYIQLSGNSFVSNLTNISRNRWTCTTFAATTLVRSPSTKKLQYCMIDPQHLGLCEPLQDGLTPVTSPSNALLRTQPCIQQRVTLIFFLELISGQCKHSKFFIPCKCSSPYSGPQDTWCMFCHFSALVSCTSPCS